MRDRQPWFDLHSPSCVDPAVAVLGLPFDGGVGFRAGAAGGPERMRRISRTSDPITRRRISLDDLTLRDFGDVSALGATGEPLSIRDYREAARLRLEELPDDSFKLVVGGDNSVSVAALEAFTAVHGPDVGILWFDAHADLFATYDGDPDSHACALRRALTLTGVAPQRAMLLATRSFAQEETQFIDEQGMDCVTAADWAAQSSTWVVERIARTLEGASAVYLAVDIDGFDASCAPGTGYPMPGGVSSEAFFAFLEQLFAALPVRGMDVTEVAPSLDHNDMTSFLAVQVVLEALAGVLSSRS